MAAPMRIVRSLVASLANKIAGDGLHSLCLKLRRRASRCLTDDFADCLLITRAHELRSVSAPTTDILAPSSEVGFGTHMQTSFDYLVGAGEERRAHFEVERLGGFQIDEQLELAGPINRDVARLGPVENLVHV